MTTPSAKKRNFENEQRAYSPWLAAGSFKHLFFAWALFALLPTVLSARIIHVPGDSVTIQGGISGAENGDTVMVSPGTYHEHGIDFLGKAITLMSTNPTDSAVVASTIVDGDSLGGVFYFRSGEDISSLLTGMTITGGFDDTGGGIYCYWYSSPTISNNVIRGNAAGLSGGGIFCWYSSPRISSNTITGNTAGTYGGGIFCRSSSDPEISDNTISGNSAGDSGGGVYCMDSSPTLSYNGIEENTAVMAGGGIACLDDASPYLTGNRIRGNSATGAERTYGGGIYCFRSSPTIYRNIISGNSSDYGGGIYAAESFSIISHNFITDNTAISSGGGIRCGSSSFPTISNNTIADNSARDYGGGIYIFMFSDPVLTNNVITRNISESYGGGMACVWVSSPSTINTIFWGNDAPTGKEIYVGGGTYPSAPTIGYSNVEGGLASVFVDTSCSIDWGSGMIESDPLWRDPDADDFRLMAVACGDMTDSPCIDAGDPSMEDFDLDCNLGLGTKRSDMGVYGGRWGEPPVSIGPGEGVPDVIPLPKAYRLSQNHPNPFNPSTSIGYRMRKRSHVVIRVFDLRGRLVRVLVDRVEEAGDHAVRWDGKDNLGRGVSSGIYLYSMETDRDFRSTRKMVLFK